MENGDVLLPLRELEKTEASVSPIIVRTSKYLGVWIGSNFVPQFSVKGKRFGREPRNLQIMQRRREKEIERQTKKIGSQLKIHSHSNQTMATQTRPHNTIFNAPHTKINGAVLPQFARCDV